MSQIVPAGSAALAPQLISAAGERADEITLDEVERVLI